MEGTSITRDSECLNVFTRSLPMKSYFNIIRFGSSLVKLFEDSIEYCEETMKKALQLISELDANYGGTELYPPLEDIFQKKCKFNQLQIFIITDGEVWRVEELLDLISKNSKDNRCFTIGIGRGCDAGLVEGMARTSGGKCDFVQEEGGARSVKKLYLNLNAHYCLVLTQLKFTLEEKEMTLLKFHLFQFQAFLHLDVKPYLFTSKTKIKIKSTGILVTASFADNSIEFPIEEIIEAENVDEDKFGCSKGIKYCISNFPTFCLQHDSKSGI